MRGFLPALRIPKSCLPLPVVIECYTILLGFSRCTSAAVSVEESHVPGRTVMSIIGRVGQYCRCIHDPAALSSQGTRRDDPGSCVSEDEKHKEGKRVWLLYVSAPLSIYYLSNKSKSVAGCQVAYYSKYYFYLLGHGLLGCV